MRIFRRSLWIGVVALAAASSCQQSDFMIYDDALLNGFQDYSFYPAGFAPDFASPAQALTGTKSIAFIPNTFASAVTFFHPTVLSTAEYGALSFWIHGGAAGGQHLVLDVQDTTVAGNFVQMQLSPASIVGGVWTHFTVDFSSLTYGGEPITQFDRIDLQSDLNSLQAVLYIDDVSLVAASGPPPVNTLQIDHDVIHGSILSDRFTWMDSANKPRVAVLAHNDQAPQNRSYGGAMREFRYQLPGNSTRVATMTNYGNGGYGGFGYVVGHTSWSSCIPGGDDSPLGFNFPGHWQRVFEGRHHAIFRFTQNYPRNCSTTNPQARTVPITIDWVFSTGHDNPLWAITWDLHAFPANLFRDDTRAPYGELNFDGDGFTYAIDGVAWGDRYKFTTTTAPVTLNSSWDWTEPNTVPYVKLWQTAAHNDATMGIVQTQTMSQQDAAGAREVGFHDVTSFWGKTSAQGNAGGTYKMPYQDEWPYQAIADSIGTGDFPDYTGSTNNARLTWRTQYGFIGQSSYLLNDQGGIGNTAPGYPKKSYSVYVVLGTHTSLPVEDQVTQVETVQSLTLTAAIGSVVATGPSGINRFGDPSDTMTYAPPGYNHVYGALAYNAAGNQLDANINVGAGTLKKPLLIIGNYTNGSYPTVKLGGVTLVQDADYFPSIRQSASELWITLNRDLGGSTDHLEIS